MNNSEFLDYMNNHAYVEKDSHVLQKFYELSERARQITMELNNKYHSPKEIRVLFSN